MNDNTWLTMFSKANPLIHLRPESTISACAEHLQGISNMLSRLSGKSRTSEVDISLANGVSTAVYALNQTLEQLSEKDLDSSLKEDAEKLSDK